MTDRTRLVGDRFRRIWKVAEEIAANPGQSRAELSVTFHLSERQVQADLNIIRTDMHLPLVRRQGYRFVSEGVATGAGALSLREAQLLVMSVKRAGGNTRAVREMAEKLPSLCPPHTQPLIAQLVDAAFHPSGTGDTFQVLANALLDDAAVALTYLDQGEHVKLELQSELLLPYLAHWYVVGEQLRGPGTTRTRMLRLDRIVKLDTIRGNR